MLPDQHQRCSDSKMKAFFSSPFSGALAWTTTFTSSQISANVKPAWLETFGFAAGAKLFSSAILEPMERKDWPSESSWWTGCRRWTNWMKIIGYKTCQHLVIKISFQRFGNRRSIYSWPNTTVSFVFSTTSFSVLTWPLSFRNFLASADVGFPPTLSHGIGLLHQHQFRQDAWSNSNVHPFHQETSMPDISCCRFCCLIAHIHEIYKIQTKHKKTRSLWKGGHFWRPLARSPSSSVVHGADSSKHHKVPLNMTNITCKKLNQDTFLSHTWKNLEV